MLTISAETLGSELEEEGQGSEREDVEANRDGSPLCLVVPCDCPL